MTSKQKKSRACFDQAISSAAADAQNSNSIVQEQGNTVQNHIFENHRSEMNDQNQQQLPQLISQPSDLIGNDGLIQQINQDSEEPELNNPISEVNNQNEGLPNNTLQFWQSLADQESAYYRGLFFQTNQPSLSLKGNAYANQPEIYKLNLQLLIFRQQHTPLNIIKIMLSRRTLNSTTWQRNKKQICLQHRQAHSTTRHYQYHTVTRGLT